MAEKWVIYNYYYTKWLKEWSQNIAKNFVNDFMNWLKKTETIGPDTEKELAEHLMVWLINKINK
jgi:hypothetical protein